MRNGKGRMMGRGRRNSLPRKMVMQFLQDNAETHFSARQIYENLFNKGISIGIASVYRNLEVLCEWGSIRKVNLGTGEAVYQFAKEASCHWHLVWPDKVEDLTPDDELIKMLDKVRTMLVKKHNIEIRDTVLNFFVKDTFYTKD